MVTRLPDTTKRQRYERLYTALKAERSSFDVHWREIAEYIFPVRFRSMTTDRNRGDRRTQKIIDSTATQAMNTLRAGLHAGVTSPARPWLNLSVADPGLAKFGPVKAWLHDLSDRMHSVFRLSNLYNALPLVYGDMGVFGTAAVGVLDDPGAMGKPGDLFRCYPYPIASYVLGMDNRGLASTFIREYPMTVEQIVEEFGGRDGRPLEHGQEIDWTGISDTVKNLWENSTYATAVDVCWIVTPNRERKPYALGHESFAWSSCHYEKGNDDGKFLRESGFHEFPILAPRWFRNAEDTYGTSSPGIDALGDIKQLQVQQKVKGKALAKMVDPPLTGPTSLMTQKVSLVSGDITYDDVREGKAGIRPIHEVQPRLLEFKEDMAEVQFRINSAFLVPLFQMLSANQFRGAQPPTAREVEELHEEKVTVLGPVLESTIDELLDPLVDRVFPMMERAGLVPPPPQELEGVDLTVEYTSFLAQALKLQYVGKTDRFVTTAMSMAAVFPAVVHKLNANAIIDAYQEDLGVDPKFVYTDDEANAAAQQQAAQQQALAQAQQIKDVSQGAKNLGSTPMTGDTALSRLVEGAAAQ